MATKDFRREFENGITLMYSHGNFDDYCVYKVFKGKKRAVHDKEYFKELFELSEEYGTDKVYSDFVKVFDNTHKNIEEGAIILIEEISRDYEDFNDVEALFTIFYMTMVAEENKAYTKLGKRIKRLGVHIYLIDNESLDYSVNFMKGMGWRQIDKLCKERGF